MASKKAKPHVSHTLPRNKGRFSKKLNTPLAVPPNAGQPAIPHVATFQAVSQTVSGHRVYLPSDEAVRQSRIEADKMLLDPVVKGPLNERFRATALADWHLEPEDKKDNVQVQVADKLTRLIKAIPNFSRYRQDLLYAEFWGRAAINNVYEYVFDGDEQYITVTKWKQIHGDKLLFDDEGNVGIKVGGNFALPEYIQKALDQTNQGRAYFLKGVERAQVVLHQAELLDGLYEDVYSAGMVNGVGIRHFLYWPWWLKQQAMGWALDALERYGKGFIVYYFTEGNPDSEAQVRAAAEAQNGSNVILFPRPIGMDKQGPGLEFKDMAGTGLNHVKDFLRDYFDSQIQRYIIGQGLSSEAAGTGLGSGVADFQKATKSDIVKMDAACLDETLTRELVWVLGEFNSLDARKIRFVSDIDDSERAELLEAAERFHKMGGVLDADHLRGEMGLPKPEPGAEVLGAAPAKPDPGIPAEEQDVADVADPFGGEPEVEE